MVVVIAVGRARSKRILDCTLRCVHLTLSVAFVCKWSSVAQSVEIFRYQGDVQTFTLKTSFGLFARSLRSDANW